MPHTPVAIAKKLFRARSGLLAVCVAGASAGCGGGIADATTTAPTPTVITQQFTGTIDPNGSVTFHFSVTEPGTITATLTSLAPVTTATVGMDLGTWDGSACSASMSNAGAGMNDRLTGNTAVVGDFCVRVYGVGNLTAQETLSVTVTHS